MSKYSIDDIARYAEGEMQPEEKLDFEKALSDDAQLEEQLALYREVHSSLQQHFTKDEQELQLRNSLQQMRTGFFAVKEKPAKVISMKRYLRSAIAVAAVFIAALLVWKPWQTDLYSDYAATQMIAPIERGENNDSLLQKATVAFNNKDFGAATQLLKIAATQQPGDSYIQFYYGVSLMQTGNLADARNNFNHLYQGQSVFKYEAAFYNALTYLKEKNKTICREWLQKIPADAANYRKARELLDKVGGYSD